MNPMLKDMFEAYFDCNKRMGYMTQDQIDKVKLTMDIKEIEKEASGVDTSGKERPSMIKFAKKTDRYYDIPELGREVPSVTTILGQLDKSGPLMGWAIKCMRQYAGQKFYQAVMEKTSMSFELVDIILDESAANYRKVQKEALDIGSEIHNLIETYLRGQKVDGLLQGNEALERPLQSFKTWQKRHDVKVIHPEHVVWSKLGYAGTTDFVGVVDGLLTVADWKSSKAIYPEYKTQVSSYRYAHEEMSGDNVQQGGVLRLPKTIEENWDAEKEWVVITPDEMDQRFKAFACLLEYWDLTKGKL